MSTKKREDLRRRRKKVEKKPSGENLNRKMTGENTLGIDVESINLKLKTCSTPRIREDCVNVRVKNVILASLEEKRLVKQGRKIYEEDDLRARKMGDTELEERRKKFREEKIKMFEKIITTPTRRKKKEESERKTTPLSLRKIGKSSQKRKVYGARERERGKISEGLRLGAASTCRKFGNFEMKIARKLVMTEGADKVIFEGASPPHNRVAGIKNQANPLARQERLKNLINGGL